MWLSASEVQIGIFDVKTNNLLNFHQAGPVEGSMSFSEKNIKWPTARMDFQISDDDWAMLFLFPGLSSEGNLKNIWLYRDGYMYFEHLYKF